MKEGSDLRNFFVLSVTIHLVSARFELVARFEGVARYYTGITNKTIGEVKMELITAINMLEQWRPIMEWDEHIKELPNELKECWDMILKTRNKGRSADKIGLSKVEIREISELINKDLQPTKAFWKYGVKYSRQKAEVLGMKDVIDSYYRRVKSYYLVDVVTKEKCQFYSLQDAAKFLKRKDYRSISKYIDRGLLITRTSYKIYKYRTFKKRKRF